jgi:ATP-dependent DNA helicase RecQ
MPEIKCPKCGALMVVRIALKGPYAGKKFYGCSRYPRCKGILPYETENSEPAESEKTSQPLPITFFPRTLIARTKIRDYQVRFFESVAVPNDMLEWINSEDIDEALLMAFSQWRIDFPINDSMIEFSEKQEQIISVIEKILTRGRITLSSPRIEEELRNKFRSPKTEYSLSLIKSLISTGFRKSRDDIFFDSKEENMFYEHILRDFMGKSYEQFVIPQVEISSLIPPYVETTEYQRVDFAIFHPKLEAKIIVEIDGEQHQKHIDADIKRDLILQEYGYTVIRIKADEVRNGSGQQLSNLKSKLLPIKEESGVRQSFTYDDQTRFIYSLRFAHQIQLVLLQALRSSAINFGGKQSWHIVTDLDEIGIFNKEEALSILEKSTDDFVELLEKLSKLYLLQLSITKPTCGLLSNEAVAGSENSIYISFTSRSAADIFTFHVQSIFYPFHIANSTFSTSPLRENLESPKEKDLEYFLQYLFRKSEFWPGQYDGIARLFQGKDALLLLPTGSGKSLVYQLTSLLLPGRTVIIDPIISLMDDQIDNLAAIGIDRCVAITSQIVEAQDRKRVIQLFGQGEYLFAFVAPERFQTVEFRESLLELTAHTPIALIAVDESHCVSEWGHDFRPAYLNIGRTTRKYCESYGKVPPLVALTGTASRVVLKDIKRELQIDDFDAVITPKSFDRKELKFTIFYSSSQEKTARLIGYLGQVLPTLFNMTASAFYQPRGKETYSGLIFCPHVNGDFGVESIARKVQKELKISTAIYSGKEPKNWNPDLYSCRKQLVTRDYKRNRIPLLVCTKAFGMGIDKPNIRYTIHMGIPQSIESFYQEAGRAGRNRKTAHCCIIVSNDDTKRANKLLNPNTTVEEIDEILKNTSWDDNDDITRVLYFHTKSFRGIDNEKRDIQEVLQHLGDLEKRGIRVLTLPNLERTNIEKALHRLLLIGVVSDYTVDYSRDEFTVILSGASSEEIIESYGNYVASYLYSRRITETEKAEQLNASSHKEFIMEMINLLLNFIYDVIERGRRRAFYEMLNACSGFPSDQDIRQRILRYLEATEYSEALEELVNDEKAGIIKCRDVFGNVRSTNEAAELRGQTSRYLESYPDHPSLLMLRSLSEVYSKDKNTEVAKQNFIASFSSALTNFRINQNIVFDFAAWGISIIASQDKKLAKELLVELNRTYPDRTLARTLIQELPIDLTEVPAWFLLSKLDQSCRELIPKIGE